jgi:cytochrome c-type biogenesis protein CcmE
MNKRSKRKLLVALVVTLVFIAAFLGFQAFEENMMYFFSPTEVKAGEAPDNRKFRVGGLVVNGTVKRIPDSLKVTFDLTDNANIMTVEYSGILPDLFREGQGIVALGALNSEGLFVADEVLAKHDENYMPPEVADALKAAEQR